MPRRPLRCRTVLLILAACGSACDTNVGPARSLLVVDSAGIRIVETRSPQWDSVTAWRLSERPRLQLGVVDGAEPELFDRIVDLALLARGDIWIANGGDETIRIFDRAGAHVRTIGGAGEGPGEFSGLMGLHVIDDRIIADQDIRRPLATYDLDGSLQSITRVGTGLAASPGLAGMVSGDGTAWAVVMHYPQGQPVQVGLFEQATPVYLLSLEGGNRVDLGVFPAARFVGIADPQGSTWQVFGPALQVTTCTSSILIGWPVTSEIHEYTPTGRLDRIIRWNRIPARVTESERQAYRSRLRTFPEGAPIPDFVRARQEAFATGMVFPDNHPSYRHVLCDSEHRIWIQQEIPGVDWTSDYPSVPLAPTRWDVLHQDGSWLGTVRLPARFLPMAISDDRVAGKYVSDLDVQFVHIYDLLRTAP